MVAPASFIPHFERWGGLDYRTSDATRKKYMARDVENCLFLSSGALSVRRGSKGRAASTGGGGLQNYAHKVGDLTVEEVLTIDADFWRLKTGSITIAYLGSEDNPSASLLPTLTGSAYSFVFKLIEAGNESISVDLGIGKDEASPVTIADLIVQINLLSTFACIATGTTTGPAAFIPNFEDGVGGGGLTIDFEYWEKVYCPLSTPFSDFWDDVGTEGFENACMQNSGDRLFIATGHGALMKYDGNSVYKAGMPCAGTDTQYVAAITGTTTSTGLTGAYEWMATYEFWDAQGQIVEGDFSNIISQTLTNQKGRITIPTIQLASGFLANSAEANNGGTATGATITVDSGHTLQVGQYAYFKDSSGDEWRSLIIAKDATHITISDSVTIDDEAIISAGIRINLWRSKAGAPGDFFLQGTYANDSSVSTLVVDDGTADSSLEIEYTAPIAGHGLPPEDLRYLTSYASSLVGSKGDDVVYFADIDGPEYFATLTAYTFNIISKSSERVSGLGANRDILIVQKENETHVVQGTLYDGKFRQTLLGDAIGTTSHFSIIDVAGTLWFYNKNFGPQRIIGNQVPDAVGYRVQPIFRKRASNGVEKFNHRRVVAVTHPVEELAIFFIPVESNGAATVESILLVADFRDQMQVDREYDDRGRIILEIPRIYWSKWTGLEMSGGATFYDDNLVWSSRHYSEALAGYEYPLIGYEDSGTENDIADFAQPIAWSYDSAWDDIESPDLLKKVIAASIFSFPEDATSFTVNVEAQADYKEGVVFSEKTVVFGAGGVSSGWGTWGWGFVAWGEVIDPRQIFPMIPKALRAIKLRFTANLWLSKPLICAWVFSSVPAFKPKTLR